MKINLIDARFKEDLKGKIIKDYELVFIPIIWARHFYVIYFNLKSYKVDVLENSAHCDGLSIEVKYDRWIGKMIKRTKIVRLKMEWRTKSNDINCGIFTMRYMEMYMERFSGWACGLANGNAPYKLQNKQLNDLRIKYTTKILLHEINKSI
ncbi:putative Ulp1 protease family catalytic domain, papain-like cysteine peptidase superfamily [Helianthus anomalus]